MKIVVTKNDISKARKEIKEDKEYSNYCLICPVSQSLKRRVKKNLSIWTGDNYVKIGKVEYTLPAEAILFILDFDHNKKVKPITFKIKN